MTDFRVRGAYLESCNCDAVCPCRMVGGVPGGRPTYGICFGLLTWRIEDGLVGDVDVSGLNVVLDYRYDEDEGGSPWTVTLHIDARGTPEQRAALADVFLNGLSHLPWIRKARRLIAVVTSAIDLADGEARIGRDVRVRATWPVATDEPVRCGIPGYDRPGQERYADVLVANGYELSGTCAFASDFDYASA